MRTPFVQLLLVVLLGLLVYADTFQVPFIFDDQWSITENPVIKDLATFLGGEGYSYNPRRFIGYLSLALNYRLGGLEVPGYHIFNLAVHLGAACLVYSLVRLTLKTPFFEGEPLQEREGARLTAVQCIPLLAALIFVVHPVQTQAVTYIVQRLASLATLFYLLSLVLYVRGRLPAPSAGRSAGAALAFRLACFLGALVSAALAMKTKEIAFTLPLIVLLYECLFFGFPTLKRILLALPMLLTLLVVPLSLVQAGRPIGQLLSDVTASTRLETDLPRLDYLYTQFRVLVTYLRLLVFPANQNLDYDYPVYHSLLAPPVLLSFLFLVALFGLALYLFFRSGRSLPRAESGAGQLLPAQLARLASFGIIWFFVTISVESSLIPIVDVIYEHRLYLPSVGICIGAGWLFFALIRKYPGNGTRIAVAACVLLLAVTAFRRNQVWKDEVTLWADVVGKSPAKARPHLNYGSVLLLAGRTDEAIREFQAAARLKPGYAEAHANLGAAYNEVGRLDEAIAELRTALRIQPDNADALNNVGISFGMKGLNDYAVTYFEAAVRLKPDHAMYRYNLATAYQDQGMKERAEEEFRMAFQLDPALARK